MKEINGIVMYNHKDRDYLKQKLLTDYIKIKQKLLTDYIKKELKT